MRQLPTATLAVAGYRGTEIPSYVICIRVKKSHLCPFFVLKRAEQFLVVSVYLEHLLLLGGSVHLHTKKEKKKEKNTER